MVKSPKIKVNTTYNSDFVPKTVPANMLELLLEAKTSGMLST